VSPCSAERARDEVEETLRYEPEARPVPLRKGTAERAAAAGEKARLALQRLHGGEVWDDRGHLRFAHGGRLYVAFRSGKGPIASVAAQTEQAVLDDLLGRFVRGGRPRIAPTPELRAQVALLVDEAAYPALLREGKIALGGGGTTDTSWLLSCRGGRYLRDSADSMGERTVQELSREQVLEILRDKRYGWVQPARPACDD
jgi:hypothetical protein